MNLLKRLHLFAFLFLVSYGNAQLNNSWIDYSKTYYKFKVAEDKLCRIPYSTLLAAGLASNNATAFQLWRNGQEVRLYTSVSNGQLSSSDYIEFLGKMNDGLPDKALYRNPDFQLADRYSLETDTASYFLTINNSSPNLRFTNALNTAPSNATPDAYFMRTIHRYYKDQMNRGDAKPVGEYVYSSSYDAGEGWSSNAIESCCPLIEEFGDLNIYSAGPSNGLSVSVNAVGDANNTRNVVIKLFQNEITAAPYSSAVSMPNFEYRRINIDNLPITLLQNPNYLPITIYGTSTNSFDRFVVSDIAVTFPAMFNFRNSNTFDFELAASATGNYLVIDNFNYGNVAPTLYDLTSGLRCEGEISSTPGKVKFVLPPSTQNRKFTLLSQQQVFNTINTLQPKNFLNLNQSVNQGDYLIISNPVLYNDGNGNNFVNDYKQYRSSITGGSYNAKVYNIDELDDQFAFGIKNHPASIRDFIMFADSAFNVNPTNIFIIGRGVNYMDVRANESNPSCTAMNLVPTFGWPASDILLAAKPGLCKPVIPIGRLAAITPQEVNSYLNKVKEYESAQQTLSPAADNKSWMKNFIHVVGGKDSSENNTFKSYMNSYKNIAQDTSFGAYVETFAKTSTGIIQQASGQRIEELFNQGLGFVGYFGHSSANTFEFNLSNPEIYHNEGKYPFFNVSGCSAGNFYVYDQLRLTGNLSLSEKYVLANQRGSIGFLADTHFGIPPFLNFYNTALYNNFSKKMYGNTIGNQIRAVIDELGGNTSTVDYFTRIHLEEINLHGDPAIKINYFAKPDFDIEDRFVKISPDIISVADTTFNIKINILNLGKAVGDSIRITVKQQLPNDSIRLLFNNLIPAIKNMDSLSLDVPINPATDKGLNKIIISVDEGNRIDEQFETNNNLTKSFYIFEDELRPVFPGNFSIVNHQNIAFYASTANPLSGQRNYIMELDTTELFNSPFKKTYNQTGVGGMVQFNPNNLSFVDSTTYYWRVAIVPNNNDPYIWNGFSLVYLQSGGSGYNQSHYFQQNKSSFSDITLDADRVLRFKKDPANLIVRTGLYPFYLSDKINVNLDFNQYDNYGCVYNSLQFYVFDSSTLAPWLNTDVNATEALYGSEHLCQNDPNSPHTTRAFFEFKYTDAAKRKKAMDFIDMLPNGVFVAITNLGNSLANNSFISQWQSDTAVLGSGNSLYHKLKSIGFNKIDSFITNLPFLYFYQKGMPTYEPKQFIGPMDSSYIDQTFPLQTIKSEGSIQSPVFGPARKWNALKWKGIAADPVSTSDTVKVQVWGIRFDGSTALLTTVNAASDTTLNFIDATQYPYLRLKMSNKDVDYHTPNQWKYWTIDAIPEPEGAVAPSLIWNMKDTVEQGEPITISIAFKNVSETNFDSLLKVKLSITDQMNDQINLDIPPRKVLVSGDTLILNYSIDSRQFPGNNTLFVDFNPGNDQIEQFHFNNILYKNFYVKTDKFNPLLDVTFDGVHILNRDIVSSKPFIHIELKDENRFMALNDTSFLSIKLKYPDQSIRTFNFGDTLRFYPADLSSGQNTAKVDFTPYLTQDGDYDLIVSGKDSMGNQSSSSDYRVSFTVINKSMISDMLNYPNPFTTSTAFVFTLTGSEIPQNIRIQILTVTGKVVKEITKSELGPIRIGRNITDYKWDGTDAYGQKLANGVYLYRVLTNQNGHALEKYRTTENNTDKYFNKGYGKMYLMR